MNAKAQQDSEKLAREAAEHARHAAILRQEAKLIRADLKSYSESVDTAIAYLTLAAQRLEMSSRYLRQDALRLIEGQTV